MEPLIDCIRLIYKANRLFTLNGNFYFGRGFSVSLVKEVKGHFAKKKKIQHEVGRASPYLGSMHTGLKCLQEFCILFILVEAAQCPCTLGHL